MKTKNRVLPALLLSLFAGMTSPAADASQFSNVYVFGDSLSDAGYFRGFLAGAGVPASLVAIMGSYTTNPGPVWSELISQHYGVTPNPSNASSGNIFAQGGARITGTPGVSTPPGQAERPIATQINEFLARGPVDSNALYAVWGGANDVFFNLGAFSAGAITQAQLQTNVLAAATAEIAQIQRLRDAGARYIAVFTLPNIGATPAFAGGATAGAVTQLSAGYNTTLFTGLQGAGIRVIPIDTFSFFSEVLASPAAYGFTNTTSMACGAFPPVTTAATANSLFCYTGNLVAAGADRTYVFADSVHPTSGAHAILAQFVESIIDGPTQHGLLAEASLRTRESHIRSLSDGIALGRKEAVGNYSVFFGGDKSNFELSTIPSMDSNPRSGTIGFTVRATDSVMLGGAYASSRTKGTFGGNAGNFGVSENIWSIFASIRAGGFYGTGVASIADTRYGDIKRNIVLGPQVRTAEANTEGSNASFHFNTGYDFYLGRFSIGPTLALTTQHVDVRGFDEAGAGSANLRIHEQKLKSEVWSLGVRAAYEFGNWTPWVRVTADEERRDDLRLVTATPLSMVAIGNSYAVPAYQLDSSYITASVGVNGNIAPNVGLSLAYYYVDSRGGVKQDGLYGLVSFRF
jgi:outer membrane lipase/esterase